METIKTYESFFKNLFKKKKNDNQEWVKNKNITDEVKETLLDLTDNDEFSVLVDFNSPDDWIFTYYSFSYITPPNYNVILIIINKRLKKTWQSNDRLYNVFDTFTMNDIKDTLEPAMSYLNDAYGLKIDKIEYRSSVSKTFRIRSGDKASIIHTNLNDIDYTKPIEHLKIFLK